MYNTRGRPGCVVFCLSFGCMRRPRVKLTGNIREIVEIRLRYADVRSFTYPGNALKRKILFWYDCWFICNRRCKQNNSYKYNMFQQKLNDTIFTTNTELAETIFMYYKLRHSSLNVSFILCCLDYTFILRNNNYGIINVK